MVTTNAPGDWAPGSFMILDPGNGGAIPSGVSGMVALKTTAAETRTLAAPTKAGTMLYLVCHTDGGDCVVTCASGLNAGGGTAKTILTFNDENEFINLVSMNTILDIYSSNPLC